VDSIEKDGMHMGDVDKVKPALLRAMYITMLRIRIFEERVADLVEAKEIQTPCHLYIGRKNY
jgi:TPP-dependent pyruvate/acetoin dehydrogenase alpha subunit